MANPDDRYLWMFIIIFFLVFLLINFNRELGTIYGIMGLAAIAGLLYLNHSGIKRYARFEVGAGDKVIQDIIYAVVAFAALIFTSSILYATIGGTTFNLSSVLNYLSATSPILSESQALAFIGWGVIIPIMESIVFFGIFLEVVNRISHSELNLKDMRSWIIFVIVAFSFAVFHLSTRGMATSAGLTFDSTGLLLTFVFGLFSCALVTMKRELSSAIYLHVLWNSAGMLKKLGVF